MSQSVINTRELERHPKQGKIIIKSISYRAVFCLYIFVTVNSLLFAKILKSLTDFEYYCIVFDQSISSLQLPPKLAPPILFIFLPASPVLLQVCTATAEQDEYQDCQGMCKVTDAITARIQKQGQYSTNMSPH